MLALAGCTHGSPSEASAGPVDFSVVIDEALDGEGLSPALREYLEDARSRGELTFEDYREGLTIFQDCAAALTVKIEFAEASNYGLKDFTFSAEPAEGSSVDIDTIPQIILPCQNSSFFPLAGVYQAQQASVDVQDAYFDSYKERLIACITTAGGDVESDASRDEVFIAANDAAESFGTDCLVDTGFAG